MDGFRFDSMARSFARRISRRGAFGAMFGLAIARSERGYAAQLTPPTCGASGAVCTMIFGCCEGLTCVTSAINTNYGVCIAGDGGTISIGTTLISPFSETVEEDLAAIANGATTSTTSTTTTTTDLEAEREQTIAARKVEKESRRTTRKSRKDTRRDTRKDAQQDGREARRLNREQRRGPQLVFSLSRSTVSGDAEQIRITNRDDTSAYISRIEVLPARRDRPEIRRTLAAGDSLYLLSGLPNGTQVGGDEYLWGDQVVCENAVTNAGFAVSAGFSEFLNNREFIISCDGSVDGGGRGQNRNKRHRGRNGNKSKNRNRQGG